MSKPKDRKDTLKGIIRKLHEGASPEQVTSEFKDAIAGTTPADIARVEEELVKEGMSPDEIHRLCDVHLGVFKESLEKDRPLAPEGHPVRILTEEHSILLKFSADLKKLSGELKGEGGLDCAGGKIEKLVATVHHLKESESHYLREENVLFPYLEKRGITQPPAMMWAEHDKIREIEKGLFATVDEREKTEFGEFAARLDEAALSLAEMLASHFYKENNVLFPAALQVIDGAEWPGIRREFDEIGYCCFTPERAEMATAAPEAAKRTVRKEEGMLEFETGSMSAEEIEAVFNSLPVDITFVDKDDTVRFYSESGGRIFVRTKAVIGRKVQQCHPQKSMHAVQGILDDFRSGKRDSAEFWINLEGKLVYIRYFPVRGKDGEYLGCLEVTQDITKIKELEGEKRLL
jgi:PAS domain S-box-containing protein